MGTVSLISEVYFLFQCTTVGKKNEVREKVEGDEDRRQLRRDSGCFLEDGVGAGGFLRFPKVFSLNCHQLRWTNVQERSCGVGLGLFGVF